MEQKHVEILQNGVQFWNQWRQEHTEIRPNLERAVLSETNRAFGESNEPASFAKCDLSNANLAGAVLRGADLRGCIFDGADLRSADLRRANLNDASLKRAKLLGTNLTLCSFVGADLTGAQIWETVLSRTKLSKAIGLETCKHGGPSPIDLGTIIKSPDMPDLFLQRCGIQPALVKQLRKLAIRNEYFSCFISYSEPDNEFVEKLYNDLIAAGLACWRWKEDAKWGASLTGKIDFAVSEYDKLVVILSVNSIESRPVIREIERAIQREDREGQGEVLFPVRLDDAVFSWQHHRKADVLERMIGDFSLWKDPKNYKIAFDRLLEGLTRPEAS